MQQYFGVIALLIVCSLIATMEYIFIKRKEGISGTIGGCLKNYAFHMFSLSFATLFFIVSAMKYFLGYHKENIFESFWDVQSITFVHYGIPLVLIAFSIPIILFYLFREFEWRVIRFFDSLMFFVITFVYFCVRKINNRVYCLAFIIAMLFSVIAVRYLKKNEIHYVNDGEIKKQFFKILPFILYWGVLIAFYTPNELYLNNASDFPMSYWYFFGKLILSFIIVLVVLLSGMILYLTERQSGIFCTVLFAVLTMGYIQGMFLNGNMGTLDGSEQIWGTSQKNANLILWIIFIAVVVAFSVWKREKALKLMRIVSIWIVLTQLVSLGVLVVSSEDTEAKSEMLLTTDGMLEVGEENNIIVFVLDMFDGRRMDDILEEAPSFLEPLKDFTYYRNATSEYFPTHNSIPFLLTGTSFNGNLSEEYVSYAYQDDSLIMDLYNNGYDIGLYTKEKYVSEELGNVVSNYEEGIERTCKLWELHSLMTQCSRYSMAPFWLKYYYVYDTSDIALLVVDERITNIEDDIPFYRRLTGDGLYVNNDPNREGTFRFIHMHGAHSPYTMTDEFQYYEYDARRDIGWYGDGNSQARGALKIVYEYIEQLKSLGKYDDATIIITADHGSVEQLADEKGNSVQASIPILFVKEPNEHNEGLQVSEAPVCHADMIVTIRKNIGMGVTEKALSDYNESEERVRIFKMINLNAYEKWQVVGNVREYSSWELLEAAERGK